jgi:hypothetical protein
MRLPFTVDQFLDVFRHYNLAVWPAQWVLAALAAAATVLALRDRPRDARWVSGILALLWLWVAFAYHVAFFAGVNRAALAFAVAFAVEGFMFAWLARRDASPSYRPRSSVAKLTGAIVIACALVGYPALGYVLGHRYPAAPTFGVPCPTTIFTLGVLVWASGSVPRRLLVVPLAWAVVATSAAVQLGMTEDFGLPIAAVVALVAALLTRERHHRPNATSPRRRVEQEGPSAASPQVGRRPTANQAMHDSFAGVDAQ